MDFQLAQTYAEMLRELGFDVQPLELAELEQAPPPEPVPEETQDEIEMNRAGLVGFVHGSHMSATRIYVPYKRMTHFSAHLTQLTGGNGGRWMKPLVTRLKKAGVKPQDKMAYFRVRKLLKKWGYTSPHYRRIFALLREMGGKTLQLRYDQEQAIRQDFLRLDSSFAEKERQGMLKHGHGGAKRRKNFVSYYLIIQLLLDKYSIKSFYKLPSVKDEEKFRSLVSIYYTISNSRAATV